MEEFKYNPALFHNLNSQNHKWNSPAVDTYNCFALAFGDETRHWGPMQGYHWPIPYPLEEDCDKLVCIIEGFEAVGFELCEDGKLEIGYEKVALYGIATSVGTVIRHASLQKESGEWASKMGEDEKPDILHLSPKDVAGLRYGKVVQFLKRRRGGA